MMRWILILAMVCAAGRADAAMMMHYDLAGLLLQSESVVVAERVGKSPVAADLTRYHVVRVLRGSAKVGTDVDLWDSLYSLDGHTLDKIVLFLDSRGGLVMSGMRVVEGGVVFRFEQWNNPGGWQMVPQGEDPIDQWRATPQLDFAGLERAIVAAGKRVDAFAAAVAERDPARRRAAVLALFPPPGASRGTGGGFYSDLLAEKAMAALGAAGDIDGALLVALRDRGITWRASDFAPAADLLAVASDSKHDIELRVAALAFARNRIADDDKLLRAVLPLVDDVDPRMRTAAIEIGGGITESFSSEAAYNRRIAAFKADLGKALAKRFAVDTDSNVLVAIAALYKDRWKRALPPRKGGPAQFARAHVVGTTVDVEIRCITPLRAKDMRVLATAGGVTTPVGAVNIWLRCGGDESGVSGGVFAPLPAGRYDLAVEVGTKPKPTTLPLGTLVVDAQHDMRVE